jgi:hypothetical protein
LANGSRIALRALRLVNLLAALWTIKALRSMPLHWRVSLTFVLVWLCIEAVFFIAQIGGILGHSRSSLWVGHLISINGTVYLITCFAVCCAVVANVTIGIRRDWLHYCGLVPIILSAGTTIANLGWNMASWWSRLISRLLP